MGPNRRAQEHERATVLAAEGARRAEAERKAVADGRRPSIRRLRAASVIGAALAVLIGIGGGQALALAGCDAVNAGGFNGFFAASSITIGGLTVGDKLTFTLVAGGADWRLENGSGGTVSGPTGFSGVQSYRRWERYDAHTKDNYFLFPFKRRLSRPPAWPPCRGDHIRLQ